MCVRMLVRDCVKDVCVVLWQMGHESECVCVSLRVFLCACNRWLFVLACTQQIAGQCPMHFEYSVSYDSYKDMHYISTCMLKKFNIFHQYKYEHK